MHPENKINLGATHVHTNVLADICAAAIADIDGVTLSRNEYKEGFLSVFGVRRNTAVNVRVEPSGHVSLTVRVVVRYGLNLTETSRRIQDAVMTATEKMADIILQDVDVSIQGIQRG